MVFSSRQLADHVLCSAPPWESELLLVFQRWNRQAGSQFRPFRFLSISNVPAHVWSLDTIQAIIGSSCLVFEASPRSLEGSSDLSSFLVVAWARHPDLIPTEVGCSVPEPVEPFVEAEPLQDPAVNVIALAAMPDRAPVAVLFPPVQWGPCWIRCSPHWTVPQRCQALGTPCSMNWGAGFGRTS